MREPSDRRDMARAGSGLCRPLPIESPQRSASETRPPAPPPPAAASSEEAPGARLPASEGLQPRHRTQLLYGKLTAATLPSRQQLKEKEKALAAETRASHLPLQGQPCVLTDHQVSTLKCNRQIDCSPHLSKLRRSERVSIFPRVAASLLAPPFAWRSSHALRDGAQQARPVLQRTWRAVGRRRTGGATCPGTCCRGCCGRAALGASHLPLLHTVSLHIATSNASKAITSSRQQVQTDVTPALRKS